MESGAINPPEPEPAEPVGTPPGPEAQAARPVGAAEQALQVLQERLDAVSAAAERLIANAPPLLPRQTRRLPQGAGNCPMRRAHLALDPMARRLCISFSPCAA